MQKSIKLNNGQDCLYYRRASGGAIEIWDIYVMSERGKGIGRELFKCLLRQENPKVVIGFTRASNIIARQFYKAIGFNEILVPKMYEQEDAYLVIYENSLHSQV